MPEGAYDIDDDDEDGADGATIVPGGETVAAARIRSRPTARSSAEGTATGEAIATGDPAATDGDTADRARATS